MANAAEIKIYGSVIKKLATLQPQLLKKAIGDHGSEFGGAADPFVVLNHGNLWSGNILFKYNNERPIDVLFVSWFFTIAI